MKQALDRLPQCPPEAIIKPTGKMAAELATILPGSGVKSPGKRETTRPGGHWGYKQGAFVADQSIAARTVTANSQQDWIIDGETGLRRLTPLECAVLQTFPCDWIACGNRSDQYRLVGNAVPPLLAKVIGKSLLATHQREPDRLGVASEPLSLPDSLQRAIAYTIREENRNGASRRAAPNRRLARLNA